MIDPLTLTVSSLACFRFTRLITDDKIFSEARNFLIRKTPRTKLQAKVKEGIRCPWCVSGHVAGGITWWLWHCGLVDQWALGWGAIWAGSILWNGLFTFLVTYSKDV